MLMMINVMKSWWWFWYGDDDEDGACGINPFAAGGLFGQYTIRQKPEKWLKPWHMGTHLRVNSVKAF